MKISLRDLSKLILCIFICQSAGAIGSIFTSSSVTTWYPTLIKPSFAPPGWFIGLVWITLFTLMGLSLFIIWNKGINRSDVKNAIIVFAIQLAINMLWSWAFFGLQSPVAGLAVIAALWIAILLTMTKFWKISRKAALLLIPYIIWVSIAAYLNFAIWRLNS